MFLKKSFLIIFPAALLLFISPAFSQDGKGARDYYRSGLEAEQAGDFYTAVEMYKSALSLNAGYSDAVIGLAHAYYGLDEYKEALKYVTEAEKLDTQNSDLLNLKGRIYLNTGEFAAAKDIFTKVLDIEENNIEAEFGLAELDIASGRVMTAENRYENVLLVSPESRKALLALVMINDEAGDLARAEIYLRQALRFYSNNSFVRYIAARHFFMTGNLDEALFHLKTALFLRPDFLDASILLCEIYMNEKRYDAVAAEIEKVLKNNQEEFILWYMLGRAYENLSEPEKSVNAYARALNIRPDEDLSRIGLENVIISKFDMKDPLRSRYSGYHVDLGLKYESRNMLEKSLKEYRRALIIDPYSVEARLLYADIFKRKGYIDRYLGILSALVDDGHQTVDILDEIEIRKSMLDETLSEKWKIDQFTVEKDANHLSIFFADGGMNHPEGEYLISDYMEYLLNGFENINVDSNSVSSDFADCYRTARENKSDYFVIFTCAENERAVSISAEIFQGSTGNSITTVNIVRTGNQMIPEAGRASADQIHGLLPVYGRIVDRKFDEILVNLGMNEGISPDDEMLIIRKGAVTRSKEGFGLEYDNSAIVGTYKAVKSEELVSDGTVTINGFYDMVNPGDIIYKKPDTEASADQNSGDNAQLFYTGNLFRSISNIP